MIKLNLSKSDLGQGFRYSSFGFLSEEAFIFRHYIRVAQYEGLTPEWTIQARGQPSKVENNLSAYPESPSEYSKGLLSFSIS